MEDGGSWLTRLMADDRRRYVLFIASLCVILGVFALYYVTSFERKQPLDDIDDMRKKYPLWHSEMSAMEDDDASDIFMGSDTSWTPVKGSEESSKEAVSQEQGGAKEAKDDSSSKGDTEKKPESQGQGKGTSLQKKSRKLMEFTNSDGFVAS